MEIVELAKYGSNLLTEEERLCIDEIDLVKRLAMRKALVSVYSQYYINLIYNGQFDVIMPKLKQIREELDLSKDENNNSFLSFIM